MDKNELKFILKKIKELDHKDAYLKEFNFILNQQTIKFIRGRFTYRIQLNDISFKEDILPFNYSIKKEIQTLEFITEYLKRRINDE